MVRTIISLISGVAAGGLAVGLIQTIALNMYPLEPGISEQQLQETLANMPMGYYWFLISSHIIGAFAAGLVTSLINRNHRVKKGLIAAGVILILTFIMNYNSPFPGWAKATDVSLTVLTGAFGSWLGSRRNT